MTKWIAAVAAGLAAFGMAAGAQATELLFSYTDASVQFSFEQSSDPTPVAVAAGQYTEVPVSDFSGNISSFSDIFWYNASDSGMFDILGGGLVVSGPQVYTGSESAPTFAPGVFDGTDATHDDAAGVLTVSEIPEPAEWMLLLAGIGALGLARRRGSARAGAQ